MICRKCGIQNDDSSMFCMACGELLPKVQSPNRIKSFRVPILYWIGGILLMVFIGVFLGYQLLHESNARSTPQAVHGKCILTTSQVTGANNETGKATLYVPYVTEDSDGCLKFVGDSIHFYMSVGEIGGVATVDIGDVHKGIQLYDDGTHGDRKPGDGIYELVYVTSPEDTARNVLILGKYMSVNGSNAIEISSQTSLTIVNWQNGVTSLDTKAEFIEDKVTGDIYVKDRLVIGFDEGTSQESIINIFADNNLKVASWIPELLLFEIELGFDQDYETIKSQLIALPSVLGVDRNYAIELLGVPVQINDNRMPIDQSNYLNVIRAKLGWKITQGDDGILVATIDSGVAVNHPDLLNKIAQYLCTPPACKYDSSDISHGTKIAGIIAAEKGKLGISGIAPGVYLIAAECVWDQKNQICGDTFYTIDRIWQIVNLDPSPKVISLSFTTRPSFILHNAITYAYNEKKAVIVAGVGEDPEGGLTFYKDQTQGDHKVYPASYEEVLAVGATETDDSVAFYSDRGDQVIYAPVPSNSGGILSTDNTGGYSISAGTSYAAPQVAALAALILSRNPNLSNFEVVNIITKTADVEVTPGLGRINVYRALMVASGQPDPGYDALPMLVTDLIAIVEQNDPPYVGFRWTPPINDYAGIHIYRKNIADASLVQLEGGLITGSEYKDQQISYGETYQYYVFSVDSLGQESVDYLATINIRIDPPPDMIAYLRDGNIWMINEDGSGEKQLTQLNLTRPDFLPSFYWSPDGSKIAFPYYPSPSYQNPYTISIINADGSNQIDIPNYLTSRMDYFSDISWLPDSQSIAFTNKTDEFHYDVYTVRKDGSNLTNYTNNQKTGYMSFVAWSPDESRMAFTSNIETHDAEDLYIMTVPDKRMVNVTNIPENELQNLIIHAAAAFPNLISWSPNGDLLAFAGLAQGTPYCGAIGTTADCKEVQNIFIATDEGKSLRNLTGPKGYDGRYDWSSDGKRIAFESNRDGNWEVYVINIDGSSLINLTNNPAEDRSPSWAPDGESIVFISDRDGNQEIYRIELESGSQMRITNTEGNELLPAYRPVNLNETIPPTLITPTPIPSLQDIDLTNTDDVIIWFSNGIKFSDIQVFEKIFTEDTLLFGTGMATEGGRDEIAREAFLQELAMRLPNHPTCVGYTVNNENKYLMIWTQGWQPKWDLLGKPFSDVLTFSLWLKNGAVSTTAYFTPSPAILGSPNIKSLPCP